MPLAFSLFKCGICGQYFTIKYPTADYPVEYAAFLDHLEEH